MKTNKKLYSIVLSLAMMLSVVSPSFASVVDYGEEWQYYPTTSYSQIFSDVPTSYWAFDYISEMTDRGVLSGYPDGKFYPNKKVTRAEFAKIMTCAAGIPASYMMYSHYDDVDNQEWCSPYIEAARYYLSGYESNGKTYYLPNNSALREDIAVALVKLKGYDTAGYDLSIIQTMFTDWQSISSGAQKYVATAVEQNLISGYEDGTFRGQQGITRAEAATLLWRAYQYGNNNKDFEQEIIEEPEPTPEPTPTPTETPHYPPHEPDFPEEPVVKPTEEPEEYDEPEKTPEPTPEPEKKTYGWKISTIKNGIDGIKYIQTVPNGVSFMYGSDSYKRKIYELDDSGKKTVIFDAEKFPYQSSEELSKRDIIKNELEAYGYNYYDNCYYAIINQSIDGKAGSTNVVFYNITLDECVYIMDRYVKWYQGDLNSDVPIKFYKNGDVQVGSPICFNSKILTSGKIIYDDHSCADCAFLVKGNSAYACVKGFEYSRIEGVDSEDPGWDWRFNAVMVGAEHFYSCNTSDEIISLDTNGDAHFLLSFDDIENEEGRAFSNYDVIRYGAITSDESKIYFYDNAYGSIRKIERQ